MFCGLIAILSYMAGSVSFALCLTILKHPDMLCGVVKDTLHVDSSISV